MTIWVDADACPQAVKQVIYKAAERTKTRTILVANSFMRTPPSAFISLEVVSKGADVADAYIVDHCDVNDLIITADIPLADLLVKKGCVAINPRGKVYTEQNIAEALGMRDFMDELRSSGQIQGGPPQMAAKNVQAFANSFDKLLTQKLRS
ncbi:MAG: YaiI/YqxD family protein [Pseudobacteriovorax sp.]|nr:YaiI/YqxD family protein [Pseudobacteriovorax sp.]